jgi:hypothetical protein
MKFEGFTPGVWLQQYQYKSFSPTRVNDQQRWEDLLERCSGGTGREAPTANALVAALVRFGMRPERIDIARNRVFAFGACLSHLLFRF